MSELTDADLRDLAKLQHPSVIGQLATELMAARARIAEWEEAYQRQKTANREHRAQLRTRIVELEAAAADDDPAYWIAGRDDRGDIRLNQGRGALIAEGDDTRAEIEGWLHRCDNSRWRLRYGAALALLNTEESSRA